jgi:adsorption protein B
VIPHDGPTSKADCLNWVYHGIVADERRRNQRYDILLMHDAEDVIHPLALRLYSLLIPSCEFVQTPVLSLPLGTRKLVAATYIDEFVEHHLKDMLVREAIGGFVPSAGVGSAFARDAFDDIARARPGAVQRREPDRGPRDRPAVPARRQARPLRVSIAAAHADGSAPRVRRTAPHRRGGRDRDPRVLPERVPRVGPPARARWITGIALQAWRQIGWQGPAAVRYCLWRDRKAIATNLLLVGAYLLVVMTTARLALTSAHMASIVVPFTPVWWLMAINLLLLVWRTAMKMRFVARLYGAGHALVSAPRLIIANVIGLAATLRAIRQYAVHALTGKPLRWYKTAHEYPSFEGSAPLPGDASRRLS